LHGGASYFWPRGAQPNISPQSISLHLSHRPIEDDHRRSGLTDERRIIGASLIERSMVSVLNAMSFANMQPTMM
jgi:hypothetical protein